MSLMQKARKNGYPICYHEQKNRIRFIKILTMILVGCGDRTIYPHGTHIASVCILLLAQVDELFPGLQLEDIGLCPKKSSSKWTQMDASTGVKMEITFQHLSVIYQK